MSDFSEQQLDKIRWMLSRCGQTAQRMATERFQVYDKGVEDYVTDVDRMLDAELFAGFAGLFPVDGIISEENAQSRSVFQQAVSRVWFIDPLDGTDDFIQGKPHYSIMVGLLENHQPRAGWIYAPAFQQLYFGGLNWGLFQATGTQSVDPLVPIAPPLRSTRCSMLIGTKDLRRFGAAIAQCLPQIEFSTLGSFGLKVMEVICGRAGLYVYFNRRVKLWDTTGPVALAQAAGLVCCDLEGNPLSFAPEAIDPDTLAHRQTILIGWPAYVEALRSPLQQIVSQVLQQPV